MAKTSRAGGKSPDLKRLFLAALAIYAALAVAFYFLAGDQLRFRNSRGNLTMPVASGSAAELTEGVTVEQVFSAKIQRLERVSAQFGAFYRSNVGTVTMELRSGDRLLLSGTFDAAEVGEGAVLSLTATEPIEEVHDIPLTLRIYADSQPGSGITPLTSDESTDGEFTLSVDGKPIPGTLCFSAEGEDYIWTGLHYWKLVIGLGAALALFFGIVLHRERTGKRSYVANAITAVSKYRFLIRQLVNRDFKTKYKRSVLGIFWSFLNPLLTMTVQYFVFSTIFKSNIPHFAAYLIIGTVMFGFFTESCGMTLTSVLSNANLITKVYMPKYIYPLTRTMSSAVNLVISLIPMLLVCLITGVQFRMAALLSVFFFVCLILFSLGMGMLLATSMVFFRDTQFLWGVVSMMWMYITPIFYPETILPDQFMIVLRLNPLYYFIKYTRLCIMDGLSPEPAAYIHCLVLALGMLLAGAAVFYKKQDEFVLYL